jgi:metal-responsive CopG/Arc/MetJ family transcriptional regulator
MFPAKEYPPKKTLTAFPPGLMVEIDETAKANHYTRSEFIREACRKQVEAFKAKKSSTTERSTKAVSSNGQEVAV